MNIKHSGPALTRSAAGVAVTVLLASGGLLSIGAAHAQFVPPMTLIGSVRDSAGIVPEGLSVDAFVGNTLCGSSKTFFVGEGDGRATIYRVNVASREDKQGCGSNGADVRVRIGERFATGSVKWEIGYTPFDVAFGTATPAPIPTSTPVSRAASPGAAGTSVVNTPTPSLTAAGGDTTPPVGTPAVAPGTQTPASTSTSLSSATPTLRGGVTTGNTTGGSGGSGDDGFPVWAAVVAALGGIALVGGGVGFMMARSRKDEEDAEALTPPAPEL